MPATETAACVGSTARAAASELQTVNVPIGGCSMRGCSKCYWGGLALSEFLFILMLVAALGLVGFLGRISLQEARRTDAAKEQAVKMLRWLDSLSANSNDIAPALKAHCVAGQPEDQSAAVKTGSAWQTCRDALALEGGPLHGYINPFSAEFPVFSEKCDRKNIATRGAIIVEESLKVPPGQTAKFVPMQAGRLLENGLAVRVTICDKGSYPIKIGEANL